MDLWVVECETDAEMIGVVGLFREWEQAIGWVLEKAQKKPGQKGRPPRVDSDEQQRRKLIAYQLPNFIKEDLIPGDTISIGRSTYFIRILPVIDWFP